MASTRTSTRETSERSHPGSGFTLIELALVLLIIGVLVTLAAPSLSVLGEARIDSSARRLSALIGYLHDEAALRGRVYRMTLDLDASRYSIEMQLPYAEAEKADDFAAGWDPYAEAADLPAGVRLVALETATGTRTGGAAAIYFLPEDAREDVVLTLLADSGSRRVLAVDGVTGRVEIAKEPSRP